MDKKIAALYIRVSTDEQTELSPDAQKRLLVDYAKKNQYQIVNEYIFVENGISGRKADKRPEFKKMIALAKSKEHPFDTILVWKFSRFARNQEESIVYKSLLKKNNVDVISISEPLPDGMIGSLVERIFEWMDEYYSINLSVEVTRGMTENALRGNYQSIVPIGYDYDKTNKCPVVNETEAELVRKIFNLYNNGSSLSQIAQKLNDAGYKSKRGGVWESRTVRYLLENPFYIGKIRWNYYDKKNNKKKDSNEVIISDASHEAIIDTDLWNSVQERLKIRTTPYKKRDTCKNKHWLIGTITCSCCGGTLAHSLNGFQCWKYTKGMCKESHYVSVNKIEEAVISGIEFAINNMKNFDIVPAKKEISNDKIIMLNKQLDKLAIKEKRAKTAYMDGIDTLEEYKENKLLIASERERIHKEIESIGLEKEISREESERIVKGRLERLLIILKDENADDVTKGNAIREVISNIVFDRKNMSLGFVFQLF